MTPSEFESAVKQWAGGQTKIIVTSPDYAEHDPLRTPMAFCVIEAFQGDRRIFVLTNPGACNTEPLDDEDIVASCHTFAFYLPVWLALLARLSTIPFNQNEIEYLSTHVGATPPDSQ